MHIIKFAKTDEVIISADTPQNLVESFVEALNNDEININDQLLEVEELKEQPQTESPLQDDQHYLGGDKIHINSRLLAREEEFRLLALAMATKLPLLFIGPSGTGKSLMVEEFARAIAGKGAKVYSYQVDDYTHPSEIIGKPELEKLLDPVKPSYSIYCPIQDADFIFIDEIHVANSGYKNAILSVLANRVIPNGRNSISLNYRGFVAAVNEIPKADKAHAFWDRFVLKHTVSRLTVEQLFTMLQSDNTKPNYSYNILIPDEKALSQQVEISGFKLELLITLLRSNCSDRTISHVKKIIKAVGLIWEMDIDRAFVKTAQLISGMKASTELSRQIINSTAAELYAGIDLLMSFNDIDNISEYSENLKNRIRTARDSSQIDDDTAEKMKDRIASVFREKNFSQK